MVRVGGAAIGRAVFSPGRRWSAGVRPPAGTSSCERAHTAYVIPGRMRARMDDGTGAAFGPGDAHYVPPATTPGWPARSPWPSPASPYRRSRQAPGPG